MTPDMSQPPGPAELAGWLQGDALTLRDACQRILNRWPFIRTLGPDVVGADVFRDFNYLATVAGVYYGTEAQPEPWNFDGALANARRGQ
jgi:hypothetical protein